MWKEECVSPERLKRFYFCEHGVCELLFWTNENSINCQDFQVVHLIKENTDTYSFFYSDKTCATHFLKTYLWNLNMKQCTGIIVQQTILFQKVL